MNYVTLWSVYLRTKDKESLNEGGHGGHGLVRSAHRAPMSLCIKR